jgi:uncharacterized protein (TIGR00730 family)
VKRRICVFAGARAGDDPIYARAAAELGAALARRGLGLVFGAGHVGLMGALSDAALAHGGEVIGVIPGALIAREHADERPIDLRVVTDMHERKALMNQLCDAFLALPGGIGTLEELFEVYTWAQLGFHRKPVALLDVGGYYAPLLEMLEHMVARGFLDHASRALLDSDTRIDALLDRLMDRLATRRG